MLKAPSSQLHFKVKDPKAQKVCSQIIKNFQSQPAIARLCQSQSDELCSLSRTKATKKLFDFLHFRDGGLQFIQRFFHLLQTQQRRMYKENYYTPVQDKYTPNKWAPREQRSQTFSAIQKSSSAHKSTEIGSYSPYRSSTVSRLEDAKRTIDAVIVDLHDKRDMNDEAIKEIKSVHSQLLDDFRRNASVYGKESATTFTPDYKSHQGSTYDLRAFAPQDDNISLRGKLNQEMRKNNELMLRVSRLQDENEYLKKDKQMTFGPLSQARDLQAENQRLKYALSQASQIPQQFYYELEELKRQNQSLRRDTVKLLHKVDRII